ncbi:hypothetical protein BKI52_03175 [marine bacterium AO1-C]|nr:hypothetical protein BKI52_03175 [marine bacterium AO1-C]
MNRYSKCLFLGVCIIVSSLSVSKAQERLLKDEQAKHKVVSRGKVSGYFRTFFMTTQNEGALRNWTAWAAGGKLKYETTFFKNFQFGIAYYTSHNLNIENVGARDAQTNRGSRYEIGLFNTTNANQRTTHLLGEAYLKYGQGKHYISLGRMKLKSPLMNPQDGRMIPTLLQGLWYKNKLLKNTTFQAGWISHVAPRSFDNFVTMAESIGINSVGRNPDGSSSGYRNQLTSKGLGIVSVDYADKKWGMKIWNYYADNIFNTLYGEVYLKGNVKGLPWKLMGQVVQQNQLNQGGNEGINQAYFQTNSSSLWGVRLQISPREKLFIFLNYNHIGKAGRFLFPREWGREPLFTFQRRERSEGMANTHAWTVGATQTWDWDNESKLVLKLGYGHYHRPLLEDAAHNKYGLVANIQSDFEAQYRFGGILKRLRLEYLMVYKAPLGNQEFNPRYIINRVNMWHHSLVLNYQF